MFSVADIMDAQYPPEYITYLVEQIPVPGKVRLIDHPQPLFPGIFLEPTEAHTWGSMNIKVNTSQGLAIICGDVVLEWAMAGTWVVMVRVLVGSNSVGREWINRIHSFFLRQEVLRPKISRIIFE